MVSQVFSKNYLSIFNTIISTSFVFPLFGVFPVIFALDLNDLEFARLSLGSSLYYCHRLPEVFE